MSAATKPATAKTVRLTRIYNTTVEHLFACFTDPRRVAQWWGPAGVSCLRAENDLKVGGRYRFEIVGEDSGEVSVSYGEYLHIEPPRRLVFTWAWEHLPEEVTQVTLAFRVLEGGRAELSLLHERFPSVERAASHNRGWTSSLDCLGALVEKELRKTSSDRIHGDA